MIFKKKIWSLSLFLKILFFTIDGYCAVDQILNDNFFQNPAELNVVNDVQLIGGNVYIVPTLNFSGTTASGKGQVQSRVHNNLPYLLVGKRFTDRVVVELDAVPSAYGQLSWPLGSFVETSSTNTELYYYRFGVQGSYQISDDLAIGLGLNDEYESNAELDYVVAGIGNQINKISGNNFIADVGLFYKINTKNYVTIAVYSPVNTFGFGSSTLGSISVNDFSLNIIDAAVAYIGLKHIYNEKWMIEGKVYWSGWSIEKQVDFINTATGSFSNPALWDDVFSFQGVSRYSITENIAFLGSIIYETNPVSIATNQIGYPLSGSLAGSLGMDLKLGHELSAQIIYGYGAFVPNAVIDNGSATGSVAANFQSFVLQFIYKT